MKKKKNHKKKEEEEEPALQYNSPTAAGGHLSRVATANDGPPPSVEMSNLFSMDFLWFHLVAEDGSCTLLML